MASLRADGRAVGPVVVGAGAAVEAVVVGADAAEVLVGAVVAVLAVVALEAQPEARVGAEVRVRAEVVPGQAGDGTAYRFAVVWEKKEEVSSDGMINHRVHAGGN